MGINKETIIITLLLLGTITLTLTLTIKFLSKKTRKDSNNKNNINQTAIGNGTYNQAGRDINDK